MKMRRIFAFVLVTVLPGPALHAQVSATPADEEAPLNAEPKGRKIGLGEAWALASKQSFAVLRARARAAVGRAEHREAMWKMAPGLVGHVGIVGVDGATQSSSTGQFDTASFTTAAPFVRVGYAANLLESFYSSVAQGGRAAALEHGAEVAGLGVKLLVADQYHDLVQAKAALDVAELARADARELVRITEVLSRQGQARGDDLARAKSALAAAEQNRMRAERAHHQASIRLAATLDLNVATPLVPENDGSDVSAHEKVGRLEELSRAALARRPETAEARSRIEASRSERKATWAGLLAPTLELYVQEGGLGRGFTSLEERRTYGALLTWNLSVASLLRPKTAAARVSEAEISASEQQQSIRAEVAAAVDELAIVEERLKPAEEQLAAAEDALRISGVRFRNGNAILLEVIEAQRGVEVARLNRLATRVDLRRARVRLGIVVGAQ